MEKNFTDKHKGGVMDNDGAEAGFRMIDMSDENGYGSTDKAAVQSKGKGTYDPQPKSAEPINYSGVEDFGEERFSGHKGATPLGPEANRKGATEIGGEGRVF